MYLISAEGYKNAEVHILIIKKAGKIWLSMKDAGSGMGVKNTSDLVLKEIHGVLEMKNPTKEQIKEYKMTEREIYVRFDNLSKEELNTKSNQKLYVKNVNMNTIIKHCRGKKKRGKRAIDGFRKKLMIPDSEIPKCPEFKVKSKIGILIMNETFFEEYSVKIYEVDPYFYEHHKEKIKVDKNGYRYILFRIDGFLTEYLSAVEIDEQNHEGREIFLKKKTRGIIKKNWLHIY